MKIENIQKLIKYFNMEMKAFPFRYQNMVTMMVFSFLLLCGVSLTAQSQCDNDDNDPVFTNCDDITHTLAAGDCSFNLQFELSASDNCSGKVGNFAHTQDVIDYEGAGCATGDAHFYQIFTPDNTERYTPFQIQSVSLGVYESLNNPLIRVNVYRTDGTLNTNNWELIGEGSAVPGANFSNLDIPVTSETILPEESFAIEVITPATAVYDYVAGLGYDAAYPTYYRAPACGYNTLIDVATLAGANRGLVLTVNGTFDETYIVPLTVGVPSLDYEFTEGVYNLTYGVTDASGNTSTCAFLLTVNGAAGVVTSIACDDEIQVSLDDDCEATIGPDEILEGGPYGCYGDYRVDIYNQFNQSIGNSVNKSHAGLTLKVSVTDGNGNSCWGVIHVEDKNPAPLECFDVYTTCLSDLRPGTPQPGLITVPASIQGGIIPDNAAFGASYPVNVFGFGNANVTDVDVILDIEHTNINNLIVTVTDPNGQTRQLLGGLGVSCVNNDDLVLTFDDEAINNFAALVNQCNPVPPVVSGVYKPMQTLSAFDNQLLNGIWYINVLDTTTTEGGIIHDLKLVFRHNGAIIPFPTTKPVTFQELGNGYYIVNGIDPCGPATLGYTDDEEEQDCDSDYAKVIVRRWVATDAAGNSSIPCFQTIYVYRNGLETLRFPPNYDGIDRPALSCTQWGDDIPGPDVTGYPEGEFCDNVQIFPYEDFIIDVCERSYKVIRKWKLVEWCSSTVLEHTQIIKVIDDQGPDMECPLDVTVSTDPLECTLDYSPARPTIYSECSDNIVYELSYYIPDATGILPEGAVFTTNPNNHTIADLPQGITYVKWTVYDDCHNKSECIFVVTVLDLVPPIAVCDQFTKVSIGAHGLAEVAAFTFDDISNDNCGIESFKARKMTNKCIGYTNIFRDSIHFCCDEVGDSIQVELRVTDHSGNTNTCMVWVKVDDKLPPYAYCPDDVTLNCQEDFKNLDLTGRPVTIDNCKVETVDFADLGSPDQCGEGLIRRTWTVKDKRGLAGSCVQRITLVDFDPFWVNESNPNDPTDDVVWPRDYDATTCHQNLNPENLPSGFGYPVILDDDCSLTSSTYKDLVFTFVEGSCEKIIRTWTVIDWCTYNELTGDGYYTYVQIIKLQNLIKPQFKTCADLTVDVYGNCEGQVVLTKEATDDCTPEAELKYSFVIDLYNDGIANAGYSGSGNKIDRVLPIGKHKITWTVEDKCSNRTNCVEIITVRDGKKPTPYCLSTVTTVVMPSSKMIEIWAKDFDHGSFDNCTPQHLLVFTFDGALPVPSLIDKEHYFKGNGVLATEAEYIAGTAQKWIPANKTSGMKFDCEDIPDGIQETITLKMYVTDLEGNQDYCTVVLILQDNTGDACDDNVGSRVDLKGKIKTENNKNLNGAMVSLYNSANFLVKQYMTTNTGEFTIENVLANKDYDLKVEKNNNHLNGVSTLDLVLIQRHILNTEKLNSAYKVIAADANNDGKVSAADLVAIRKLILGLTGEFPSNQKSWRFVDAAQHFGNPQSPFPFNEVIKLSNLSTDMNNQDFYAIKIGDVNSSIVLNANDVNPEPRSSKSLDMLYDITKDGGQTIIDFYSTESISLLGFQTSLDLKGLNVADIRKGDLNLGLENINNNERSLLVSWSSESLTEIGANVKLFSLVVDGDISNLAVAEDLASEAYFSTTEVSKINLNLRNDVVSSEGFEVYQNQPNPFAKQTTIGFKLPEAGKVNLKVYDQTGRILYRESKNFEAGVNNFVVEQSQLRTTGIMYYEISSQQYKATKKMVGLN